MGFAALIGALIASTLLNGCATAVGISPDKSNVASAEQSLWLSSGWLLAHRAEVEDRVVEYIKTRYPRVPPDVRNFRIGKVHLANNVRDAEWEPPGRLEDALRDIFQSTVSRILAGHGDSDVVVDLDVSFREDKGVSAAKVAVLPVCFASVFAVCPVSFERYVALEATVTENKVRVGSVTGYGGAARIVGSPLVDDSVDPRVTGEAKATTEALAAAIADVGAKMVPYLRPHGT